MTATTTTHLSRADFWLNFEPSRNDQCVKGVISYYATALSARITRYGVFFTHTNQKGPSVETSTGPLSVFRIVPCLVVRTTVEGFLNTNNDFSMSSYQLGGASSDGI